MMYVIYYYIDILLWFILLSVQIAKYEFFSTSMTFIIFLESLMLSKTKKIMGITSMMTTQMSFS